MYMLCYCGWVETTQPNYFVFPLWHHFVESVRDCLNSSCPVLKWPKYTIDIVVIIEFFGLHWRDGRCSMFWVPGWPYSWCHVTGFELPRNCVQRRKEQHVYSNFRSRWSHPGHSRSSMQSLAKPHQCLVMTCHGLSLVHHVQCHGRGSPHELRLVILAMLCLIMIDLKIWISTSCSKTNCIILYYYLLLPFLGKGDGIVI